MSGRLGRLWAAIGPDVAGDVDREQHLAGVLRLLEDARA